PCRGGVAAGAGQPLVSAHHAGIARLYRAGAQRARNRSGGVCRTPAMTQSSSTSPDVRMRGFARRARVADALAWIDREVRALEAEAVALDALHGRVLAEDMMAGLDVPAFDRSAMDGYALRGGETTGAAEYNPIAFEVVGAALPGRPYEGAVEPGTAVRIMTGAPMPAGADAVLPAEFAHERDGRVEVAAPLAPAKNVG